MAFTSIAPLKNKNTEFPPFPKRGQIKARIFQSLISAVRGGLNGRNSKFRRIPKRGRIKDRIFQSLIDALFSLIGGGLIGNLPGGGGA